MLTDFFAVFAQVRAFTDQQLEGNNPNRIVVSPEGVIFTHEHFRGHVPRCATGLMRVLGSPVPRDPEISHPAVPFFVKNDILRLQIPMNDIFRMQIVQSFHNTPDNELCMQ